MWPAVKLGFTQEQFGAYVRQMTWPRWRPSKIVWHNTAAPSLVQWMKSAQADAAAKKIPGITRIGNLERFFQVDNGWSGCPHLFVANDLIWVMNPLTYPGVHSPSWNSTSIGIEMVGDFAVEDDEHGEGLRVKNNTIFATAILCAQLGLDPNECIYLHKQDPKTTHDCPGRNIAQDKFKMIHAVQDLMAGGEHSHADTALVINGITPEPTPSTSGLTLIGDLNIRRGPGVINPSLGVLPRNLMVQIFGEAKNGTTSWLRVKTPAGVTGWVAGGFIRRIV